jgi:hypothetical protein
MKKIIKPVRKFAVRNDLYPYPVLFWLGAFDGPKVRAWLKREKVGNDSLLIDPDGTDAACCYDLGNGSLVWMPHQTEFVHEMGTLAHELMHAVEHAGRTLGFRLSSKSCEFYCYFFEFLTVRALRRILRK